MSGFSSLNVGAGALAAAQRALDVTGQNVSNVNTAGYSRQRVQQVAQGGSVVPAMYALADPAGDGVSVTGILRAGDGFLDARANQEHAAYAGLGALNQTYADVEATFAEPSTTGLQAQMSSFWSAWDDVANDPSGAAPRRLMLESAGTLTTTFNGLHTQLGQQWAATRAQAGTAVADVNSMAAQVARLNQAIRSATLSGGAAGELLDQRDALVRGLAQATGATAVPGEDGVVDVSLAGGSLVKGDHSMTLQVTGPATFAGTAGGVQVAWAPGGQPVAISSGTVQGLLTAVNVTLPGMSDALDAVAKSLADTVNAQQAKGFDASGGPGAALFTGSTAAGLTVALTTPGALAASSAPPPALDGGNAGAMSRHAADLAGPDAGYRDMMVQLGVQAQSIGRRVDAQGAVTQQVDNARDSVVGVSLDEEMTNLMAYQHAYSAAARYVTVIDSTLDTLINMGH